MPLTPPATPDLPAQTSPPSLGHLIQRRRLQLGLLLLVMLASSAAEVLSLAAVLPFLVVMANPDELEPAVGAAVGAAAGDRQRRGAAAADHDCLCGGCLGDDPAAEHVAERTAGGGDRFGYEL